MQDDERESRLHRRCVVREQHLGNFAEQVSPLGVWIQVRAAYFMLRCILPQSIFCISLKRRLAGILSFSP